MRIRSAVFLALLAAPSAMLAQDSGEHAVIAVVERMFEGMRTADSAVARSVFAPGARFASVDTRTTPPSVRFDAVDGWIAAIAGSNRRWDERLYDVVARVDAGIAHVWAPYTFYLDRAVRHCGVNTIELLKVGDAWKITQISDSRRSDGCPDPPAPR